MQIIKFSTHDVVFKAKVKLKKLYRALAIANKLTDKKHRSRIFSRINKIRGIISKISKGVRSFSGEQLVLVYGDKPTLFV